MSWMRPRHKVPLQPPRQVSQRCEDTLSEGAAEGLIQCGDIEGVAQYNQSRISKLNSRWTALPDSSSNHIWPTVLWVRPTVLWVRCGWWQTGSQWDSWRSFASETGCIIVVVQMRSAPVGNRLKWLVCATVTEPIWYSCLRGSVMWSC